MLKESKPSLNATQAFGVMMIATMALALFTADYRGANARPIPPSNHPAYGAAIGGQQGLQGAYAAHNIANGVHGAASLGLVQSGIVGVSQMDATGQFSAPTAMPIYQIIRVHAPARVAAHHGSPLYAPPAAQNPVAPQAHNAPKKTNSNSLPGITVSPSTQAASGPTQCEINGVSLLTPSADACSKAGGKTVAQPQ